MLEKLHSIQAVPFFKSCSPSSNLIDRVIENVDYRESFTCANRRWNGWISAIYPIIFLLVALSHLFLLHQNSNSLQKRTTRSKIPIPKTAREGRPQIHPHPLTVNTRRNLHYRHLPVPSPIHLYLINTWLPSLHVWNRVDSWVSGSSFPRLFRPPTLRLLG